MLVQTSSWAGRPSRPETLAIDSDRSDLDEIVDKDSHVKRSDPAIHTVGDKYDEYPSSSALSGAVTAAGAANRSPELRARCDD